MYVTTQAQRLSDQHHVAANVADFEERACVMQVSYMSKLEKSERELA